MNTKNQARWIAALVALESLLIFVPIIVLGAAISWPDSLDFSADEQLTSIYDEADAVRLGYVAYLIYSILFWPVGLLIIRVVSQEDRPLLQIAAGFAAISTMARTIGIVRWLVPMPVLAEQYADPNTAETTRAAIEVTFQALTDFGGTIGEVLGVSIFAATWLVLVSVVILRTDTLPRWLGLSGLVAGILLYAPALELLDIDTGSIIAISTTGIQIWLLAFAGVLAFGKRTA